MTRIRAQQAPFPRARADVMASFVFEDEKLRKAQLARLVSRVTGIATQLKAGWFRGKEGETLLLYPDRAGAARLLLVGLGPSEGFGLERVRRASAAAARWARDQKAESLALWETDPEILPRLASDLGSDPWRSLGEAMAEGAILSLYRFDRYLSKEADHREVRDLLLLSENRGRARDLQAGVRRARIVCEAVCLARDLSNAPGNEIFPDSLAAQAKRVGRKHGFAVTAFGAQKIRQMGMGGLTAVAQGSDQPARFIVMDYRGGTRRSPTVVLVGKGVTFDSGGISIKPSANMSEMKMDMAGAAAVMGTLQAAAQLRIPLRLVGLIPAAENLPGGSSLKPGDILRHLNGKTSEVDNTDAEGRLILADALAYAGRFKPDVVIDLATLTGACVVALGHVATGMMGNDQQVMDRLRLSGEKTYERVWQLPLFTEYEKLIKSDVADVKNVGGRWAGAITAGLFLKKFIGNYRWVHLDIAGTAILEDAGDYIPKGGSGVGVRLLTYFLQHWERDS